MIKWEEIAKQFSTLPPEKWDELLIGLTLEERNKVEQAIKVWKVFEISEKPFPIDKENDWKTIMERINGSSAKVVPISRPVYWTSWTKWAAAVLVVALMLGTLVFNRFSREHLITQVTGEREIKSIILPDGTHVTLNENSQLTYPENFKENQRNITFTGEAWFDVKRNVSSPFKIVGQNTIVTVLGTSFNYKDIKDEAQLFVTSGKVAFVTASQSDSVVLVKGQQGSLNKQSSKFIVSPLADENFLAWKTGVLKFEDKPLPEVIAQLDGYYNIRTNIEGASLGDCRFTGKFESITKEEVFEILTAMYNLKVVQTKQDNYILTGSGWCTKDGN